MQGKIDAISFPMLAGENAQIVKVSLIKGAMATTAIEGNTLSKRKWLTFTKERNLRQAVSIWKEVKNVIDALNTILNDV